MQDTPSTDCNLTPSAWTSRGAISGVRWAAWVQHSMRCHSCAPNASNTCRIRIGMDFNIR
eukprot:8281495-Pyramimonas_sp.AAC.1